MTTPDPSRRRVFHLEHSASSPYRGERQPRRSPPAEGATPSAAPTRLFIVEWPSLGTCRASRRRTRRSSIATEMTAGRWNGSSSPTGSLGRRSSRCSVRRTSTSDQGGVLGSPSRSGYAGGRSPRPSAHGKPTPRNWGYLCGRIRTSTSGTGFACAAFSAEKFRSPRSRRPRAADRSPSARSTRTKRSEGGRLDGR